MNLDRNAVLIGVAILVVAFVIVVPVVVSTTKSSRLEEVVNNVNAIRQAELDYHDAFADYVSADAAPRPPYAVDPNPVVWEPTEGFKKLSWSPETAEVIGSYQVQADKNGFKVVGVIDVDGDGERAVYEATHEEEAHAVTGSGVY